MDGKIAIVAELFYIIPGFNERWELFSGKIDKGLFNVGFGAGFRDVNRDFGSV